jgi:signal transduction histidine kinase
MRITTKFIGSAVAFIALTTILSGSRMVLVTRADQTLSQNREAVQKTTYTILSLQLALREQNTSLQNHLLLKPSPVYADKYAKAEQRIVTSLDELFQLIPASDQLTHLRLNSIKRRHQQVKTNHTKILQPSQKSPEEISQFLLAINTYEQDINAYTWELMDTISDQTKIHNQQINAARRQAFLLETASLSAIILLFLAQFRSIVSPALKAIQTLRKGAQIIGQGDLTHSIKIHTGDELQELAHALNHMSSQIGHAYSDLEHKVKERTLALTQSNQALGNEVQERIATEESLKQTLEQLRQTQSQLIQTEKMSSLGQLVAGIAHEINNPLSFIAGNLVISEGYFKDLLDLIQYCETPEFASSQDLAKAIDRVDLPFLQADIPKLIGSMQNGIDRISNIVASLKTFSHLDESDCKVVDIHQGIESTLMLLNSRLTVSGNRRSIQVFKHYDSLPKIECYPSQLNQVLMNLLTNAIDAIEARRDRLEVQSTGFIPQISIQTQQLEQTARIAITDNGGGIDSAIQNRIFDPFFTTKSVGQGTGLGLSLSYQIITQTHQGKLWCQSSSEMGSTQFVIEIPLQLPPQSHPTSGRQQPNTLIQ